MNAVPVGAVILNSGSKALKECLEMSRKEKPAAVNIRFTDATKSLE